MIGASVWSPFDSVVPDYVLKPLVTAVGLIWLADPVWEIALHGTVRAVGHGIEEASYVEAK